MDEHALTTREFYLLAAMNQARSPEEFDAARADFDEYIRSRPELLEKPEHHMWYYGRKFLQREIESYKVSE